MAQDLRTYLKQLKEQAPEEIQCVSREVSHEFEPIAVTTKAGQEGIYPAIFFERMKGYEFPVLSNLLTNRKKLAVALGTTEDKVPEVLAQRELQRIPRKKVNTGPVKDVIYVGQEVDLHQLPIILHYVQNDAPYITMGVLVSKDPETGAFNLGLYRHKLISRNQLGVYYSWGKRLQYMHRKAEKLNEPLECAIVIGMHPALHMASQSQLTRKDGTDEYEVAGGILGEPIEVVCCETVEVDVPANAEIVIEGKILPNVRQREGPFGEYHRYLGQIVDAPVFEVTAITHRFDAIYHNVGQYVEQVILSAIPNEGHLLRELRRSLPTVKNIRVPLSGVLFHAYIQMEKVNEGDAKNVLMAALTRTPWIKHAFVFDSDVDIFDEDDILWALSTRVTPERDIITIPGARGNRLDPNTYTLTRLNRDGMVTKMGIDATKPIGYKNPFPKRAKIQSLEDFQLEEFLEIKI